MSFDSIKAIQAVGILGCALASGSITSISLLTIPTLILPAHKTPSAPANVEITPGSSINHLTHQWIFLYNRGKRVLPALCATASAGFAYLSWSGEPNSGCYAFASLATIGIVPFTLATMQTINVKLEEHAVRDDASEMEGTEGMKMSDQERAKRAREDQEAMAMLKRWSMLNAVRGLFPLTGAVVGFLATVCVS